MSTLMTNFASSLAEPSNAWAQDLDDFTSFAERQSLLVEHWRKVLPAERLHMIDVRQ